MNNSFPLLNNGHLIIFKWCIVALSPCKKDPCCKEPMPIITKLTFEDNFPIISNLLPILQKLQNKPKDPSIEFMSVRRWCIYINSCMQILEMSLENRVRFLEGNILKENVHVTQRGQFRVFYHVEEGTPD